METRLADGLVMPLPIDPWSHAVVLTLFYLGVKFFPTLWFCEKMNFYNWTEYSWQSLNMLGIFFVLNLGSIGGIDNFWHTPWIFFQLLPNKLELWDRNSWKSTEAILMKLGHMIKYIIPRRLQPISVL